ncbi:MAG: MFS transporter [Candidatus Lokiarchaeota archaeon]|nr:MFS transporter [Candidatus Lokiarchaeota archaeon]
MENHKNDTPREVVQLDSKKSIWAWALYDWANSAFATTIMAAFIPIFLGEYWGKGILTEVQQTQWLGNTNAIASLVVAILAPILGAIADKMGNKKRFLGFFALLGSLVTGALSLLLEGQYKLAMILYGFGILGFSGANIFYDAILVGVASEKKIDYVSSLGYAIGYIGGGLLFTLNAVMYIAPGLFGIQNEIRAIQWAFVSVMVWWIIFSIPLFIRVKEPPVAEKLKYTQAIKGGFRQLWETLKDIKHLKYVGIFLLAFWLYIDGVDTIIRMALDYGTALAEQGQIEDLAATDLAIILLMVQYIAFPATLLFNLFAKKIGTKKGILIAIGGYMGITVFGYFITAKWQFFIIGGAIALFQGGIQALSRSAYSRLIPEGKSAQFYGFFNMLGKFAAVVGPFLMATITGATGNHRLGLLSLLILFGLGFILLLFVDFEKGEKMAREYLGKGELIKDGKLVGE